MPIIYVSHSPDEIARLADYLILLENGKPIASGPLNSVLSRIDLPWPLLMMPGWWLEAEVAEHEADNLTPAEFSRGEIFVCSAMKSLVRPLRCRIHARDVSLALSPQK